MNLIVDEAILEETVKTELSSADCPYCQHHRIPLETTLKGLWQIARAAKRWWIAPPGLASSERESELAEMLREMPPTPNGYRRGDDE